jgi:shikimate kinase
MPDNHMNNIILIGLPGSGKSTLGVILAKTLGLRFVDTDIIIQEHTGRLLQEIINTVGAEEFLRVEEACILSLDCSDTVIATGGSVVYSSRAMQHLKSGGITIYLEISCEEMISRLKNIVTRGVVLKSGQSLRDMYYQRIPLYEMYADIRVDCSDEAFESVVEKVAMKIKGMNARIT